MNAEEQLKALIPAARSALSALRYVEKELHDLRDVLPELQPANRCLYALAGEAEKLSAALPPVAQSVNGAQRTFIGAIDKAIAFHTQNQNDPHGIGNAVIAALNEVKTASMEAYKVDQNEA
jgi:hypothetical protein